MRIAFPLLLLSGCGDGPVAPSPNADLAMSDLLLADDEPIPEMRQIFQAASAWWAQHPGSFPSGASLTPAAGECCAQIGAVCAAEPIFWSASPWSDFGFAMKRPFLYGYSFQSDAQAMPPTFTIHASSDLNCNGVFSDWSMTGTLSNNAFTGIDDVSIQRKYE